MCFALEFLRRSAPLLFSQLECCCRSSPCFTGCGASAADGPFASAQLRRRHENHGNRPDLLVTVARLAGSGGSRSMVAESVLVKPQLLIRSKTRFSRYGA
jgi:hypothetical protein